MLNWLTRYAFVWEALSFDEAGRLRESVLDVGCGPHRLSALVVAADMLPEYGSHATVEFQQQREGWLDVFRAARLGTCCRKGYVLERVGTRAPLVDPARTLPTALAAARCSACAKCGLSLDDGYARCGSCAPWIRRPSQRPRLACSPRPPATGTAGRDWPLRGVSALRSCSSTAPTA